MSKEKKSTIKFVQGDSKIFYVNLLLLKDGVMQPWVFPALDSDIVEISVNMPKDPSGFKTFTFKNGTTDKVVTIEDRPGAKLKVSLTKTQTNEILAFEDGQDVQIKVEQTISSVNMVKHFTFEGILYVSQPIFE